MKGGFVVDSIKPVENFDRQRYKVDSKVASHPRSFSSRFFLFFQDVENKFENKNENRNIYLVFVEIIETLMNNNKLGK